MKNSLQDLGRGSPRNLGFRSRLAASSSLFVIPLPVILASLCLVLPLTLQAGPPTSSAQQQAKTQQEPTDQLHDLGLRYEQSNTRSLSNYRRAYWAYCVAARHGHAEAAYRIAWMYLNGRGLAQDDRLAGHWLSLSAKLGDQQAQYLLERLSPDIADDDFNCPVSISNKVIDVNRFKRGIDRLMPPRLSLFDVKPQIEASTQEQGKTVVTTLNTTKNVPSNKASHSLRKKTDEQPQQQGELSLTPSSACPWVIAAVYPSYRKRVLAWLDKQTIEYTIRKQADTLNHYHIVMIYPNDPRSKALSIASQLHADGYASTRIFGSGEYKHAVSLGVFHRAESAKALLKKLQGRGYNAIERIMKHPPVIPIITTRLTAEQKQNLKVAFPPLNIAQANCS